MLDAVDAGGHQLVDRLFTEAVRGDAGPLLVCGGDRGGRDIRGPQGRQVPHRSVDPVPDELDPPVAVACLVTHLLDELLRLHLGTQVPDVAQRPGDVPARTDQPRQLRGLLHPPGVGRRPRIPDQHGARRQVRLGLGPRGLRAHRPLRAEPDVAVGVHEAGDHPRVRRDRLGPGHGLIDKHTVDDPHLPRLGLREEHAREVQG